MPEVRVYDTTLRDGSQGEGLSFTLADKLRIARRLAESGVAYVEGGWPGSNPKDAEFFRAARDLDLGATRLAAFGSTRRSDRTAENDQQVALLLDAGTPVVTVFGKSSKLQVTEVLRTTLEENLRMVSSTVALLAREGREVVYDAEHFFDAFRTDRGYALTTLRAALEAGARVLVLCDTNGGNLPWQIEEAVSEVRRALPAAELGVHLHDDAGTAVASTLIAVRAGARHVQGTVNGWGERTGNANWLVVAANLELKMGVSCLPAGKLAGLTELSRFVAEVANVAVPNGMPYVGKSAFAHKGGVHVAAMRRTPLSYQHVEPALVGNESRVVVSELSGRANLLAKAEELGVAVAEGAEGGLLADVKEGEHRGLSFDAAEASVALLLARAAPGWEPPFELLEFSATSARRGGGAYAEAVVKLRVGQEVLHTAAEGTGPVGALDSALRKALTAKYPELSSLHLADYKVRILDGERGTQATTRVLIDFRDDAGRCWSTVGASENVVEASLSALLDGLTWGLVRDRLPSPEQRVA